MKIRIIKLDGTGISTDHYAVGDVVDATPSWRTANTAEIADPRGGTYLLLPDWYEVVLP